MRCPEAFELMSRSVDGETSEEEEQLLRQHLAICQRCAKEWMYLRCVDRLFAQAPLACPPADLSARIVQRVTRRRRRQRLVRFLPSLALIVGLMVIAALAPLFIVSGYLVRNAPVIYALVDIIIQMAILARAIGGVLQELLGSLMSTGHYGLLVGWSGGALAALGLWVYAVTRLAPARLRSASR